MHPDDSYSLPDIEKHLGIIHELTPLIIKSTPKHMRFNSVPDTRIDTIEDEERSKEFQAK
jgi:hypothetical protein